MTAPIYGLTPAGFVKKPLEVVKSEIETGLQAEFGEVNVEPESVFGQLVGTGAKGIEDLWETLEAVYFSQYPNSAEGTALDNVALILGITRLPATRTKVIATVGGTEGTVIPIGSLATQPGGNYTFEAVQTGIISRAAANYAEVTATPFTTGLTYTISIDGIPYSQVAPGTSTAMIAAFVAQIGNFASSTHSYYATAIDADSLSIQSYDSEIPFNLTAGPNLVASGITSPMQFQATQTGPIVVPIGTLTQTVTSILGWQTITNLKAGATGTNIETDAELRLRRSRAFVVGGYATVESIRSRLLQEVPGVTSVEIIENRTMTQTPLTFSIAADLVAGDLVDVFIDGATLGQVAYDSWGTQQLTMQAIATLIAGQAGVLSAVVSGSPYRTITITFIQGYQLTENNLIIERGFPIQFIPFSKSGGRPPKSFETIVEGGTDIDVANKIWFTKPAGIETFGNTRVIITDSMGNQQAIFFTRAQGLNIWVKVDAVINPEEPLAGGSIAAAQEIIKNAIMEYAATLRIGMDIINQRVMCKVIDTSGIGSAVVTIAVRTDNATPGPGEYVGGNISIADDQVAVFNKDQITVNIT